MENIGHSHEYVHGNLAGERELSKEFAEEVLWTLASDEPLIQNDGFDNLVQSFEEQTPHDTYQTVVQLADLSPVMAKLLSGRTGVREGYRLHEHTQAVLNGFEADYASEVADPQLVKLLRTTLLLQDMGKSLCIAHCGNRREQAPYNAAVVDNLLMSVEDSTLDQDDKQTITLLLGHDLLGSALKGYKAIEEAEAQQAITQRGGDFPAKYSDNYKLLMRIVYMADVSAYTDYRSYISAETGEAVACLPALNKEYEVLTTDETGRVVFRDQAKNELLDRLTVPLAY